MLLSTSIDNLEGKLCYIVSYRHPNYIRTDSILKELSSNRKIIVFKAINKFVLPVRYVETFFKFLWIRIFYNPEYYLIGFRGHELFFFIYPFIFNKKIIFDEFVSPYDSYVNERKMIKKNSLLAKVIFYLERFILEKSWRVLVDTESNKNYYSRLFKVTPEKFIVVSLTIGNYFFQLLKQAKGKSPYNKTKFNVFFYGTMLPLHGVDIIYEAAKIIEKNDENIHFTIIGKPEYNDKRVNYYLERLKRLSNVTYVKWVDYWILLRFIKYADVCLGGPFGLTGQANRVITGKTLQFLSVNKPTIIGLNAETRKIKSLNAFFVKQGNPNNLANMIIKLKKKCEKN